MINRIINLHTNKLNLSHLAILESEELLESLEGHTLYKQLERGGYIFKREITEKGSELLRLVDDEVNYNKPSSRGKKVKVEYTPEFTLWWDTFPSSDMFTYQGKEFIGSRNLRVKKPECFKVFQELLPTYGLERMVNALKKEVQVRKDLSFKKMKNELSYMRSTLPYLNSRVFELFLDKSLASSENNVTFVRHNF